ncbi:MAG: DUF6048 family protein [Bacteroidales bacterium]
MSSTVYIKRKVLAGSLLLINLSAGMTAFAQDTVPKISHEVFLAFDGWGLAEQLVVPGKYSINGKMGWIHRTSFAITVDGGYMHFFRQVNDSIKSFDYRSSGYYVRGGVERNIFRRNRPNERNFIFLGLHLGYSNTQHRADNIVIPDKFWGTRYFSIGSSVHQSVWLDFSIGLRTQLARYFALGWEVKLSRIIYTSSGGSITPYYLAGFGKSRNALLLGVNYYLYYTFGW